ncbi:MAG: SAM-dependent methyltransferase [Armatimonadota bacterium]
MITIAGLGPSGSDSISTGAYRAIRNAPVVFVRTTHHPAVDDLKAEGITIISMDDIYESSDTFQDVYNKIADKILAEAQCTDVVYAVPGHPLMGEQAVEIIIRKAKELGIDIKILGSESFIEASMDALLTGLDTGLKIIDALSMKTVKADTVIGNLIYQVYNRAIASDVKLALMEDYPDNFEIRVVVGAGTASQQVVDLPLYMLDRRDWDHLTTVYVPPFGEKQDRKAVGI